MVRLRAVGMASMINCFCRCWLGSVMMITFLPVACRFRYFTMVCSKIALVGNVWKRLGKFAISRLLSGEKTGVFFFASIDETLSMFFWKSGLITASVLSKSGRETIAATLLSFLSVS